MPKVNKLNNAINPDTISEQIDNVVVSFFDNYNINIYDMKDIKTVSHNMLNLCFREIYKRLFKPDHKLINNQKSLIDYNDAVILQILADKFIDICQHFNKSLGLMSFSFMIGIDYKTLYNWLQAEELNPKRFQVLKNVQECHKLAQVSLLNDSPVGALAVANNDSETGLNWSANQVQQITNNTVYYLPSERTDRLNLEKIDG
jgi:hypothetical protein